MAFCASPFLVTGMFRLGVPSGLPLIVLLAAAVAAWFRRRRAIAVGLAAGTLAWFVALLLIIRDMGNGIESIG